MRMRFVWLGLLVLTATSVFAAITIRSRSSEMRPEVVSSPGLSVSQQSTERGPVRMLRFVLFEAGIYPRRLRVQQGLINLAIEDKTNSSAGLVIERENGNGRARVGQVQRFANHWRGRELFRLPPGRYHLYDSSRPNNVAELEVEP